MSRILGFRRGDANCITPWCPSIVQRYPPIVACEEGIATGHSMAQPAGVVAVPAEKTMNVPADGH